MQTHSPYFANFYARLITSQLGKGHIKVFLSKHSRPANRCGVPVDELQALLTTVEKVRPRCTPEHEAEGIAFLLNKVFTPKGNFRKTEHARQFDAAIQLFLQQRRDNLRIHWVDAGFIKDALVAVYEVSTIRETPRGCMKSFRYMATPWQSGGYFEILGKELNT